MAVFRDRKRPYHPAVSNIWRIAMSPFKEYPAVVLTAGAIRRLIVDLLPSHLANIGNVEIAIGGVEAELPGVA